jgi:hypothetical protein
MHPSCPQSAPGGAALLSREVAAYLVANPLARTSTLGRTAEVALSRDASMQRSSAGDAATLRGDAAAPAAAPPAPGAARAVAEATEGGGSAADIDGDAAAGLAGRSHSLHPAGGRVAALQRLALQGVRRSGSATARAPRAHRARGEPPSLPLSPMRAVFSRLSGGAGEVPRSPRGQPPLPLSPMRAVFSRLSGAGDSPRARGSLTVGSQLVGSTSLRASAPGLPSPHPLGGPLAVSMPEGALGSSGTPGSVRSRAAHGGSGRRGAMAEAWTPRDFSRWRDAGPQDALQMEDALFSEWPRR